MANNCVTLTSGRKLPCKGGSGGFRAVGFLPWEDGLVVGDEGIIESLDPAITAIYRYELKHSGNTYTEDIQSDADARTIDFVGTLAIVLHKLNVDTRNEVKMLAMGELIVFVETNNGDILCIGSTNGAELTGGGATTGGSKSDFNGWNLTFTTSETEPYLTLGPTAKVEYAGVVVNGI